MTVTIVGQGLAGSLAALAAWDRGLDFVVIDEQGGQTASRAAAGLFHPLIGPRFTPSDVNWLGLIPFYRHWEQRLGRSLVHVQDFLRPWATAKIPASRLTRTGPGWSTSWETVHGEVFLREQGGGWIDIPMLLDSVRQRLSHEGRLQERVVSENELRGKTVWWCTGVPGLLSRAWAPLVEGRWQGVRGDVTTWKTNQNPLPPALIAQRFVLPMGPGLVRFGATHEADVLDWQPRPSALETLRQDWLRYGGKQDDELSQHAWGVRPSSRNGKPLILVHPDEPGWTLFNGFGGKGVSQIPSSLVALGL